MISGSALTHAIRAEGAWMKLATVLLRLAYRYPDEWNWNTDIAEARQALEDMQNGQAYIIEDEDALDKLTTKLPEIERELLLIDASTEDGLKQLLEYRNQLISLLDDVLSSIKSTYEPEPTYLM